MSEGMPGYKFAADKLRAEIKRQGDVVKITDVEANYIAGLLDAAETSRRDALEEGAQRAEAMAQTWEAEMAASLTSMTWASVLAYRAEACRLVAAQIRQTAEKNT